MAFGSSSIHLLTHIDSYEAARKLFDTPHPKRNRSWPEYRRPLRNHKMQHYWVEAGSDYYDVGLYSTVMGRFYKPTIREDGSEERVVHVQPHHSSTSRQFLYYVLGVGGQRRFTTTDNRQVYVGMNTSAGGSLPVRLVFVNRKLDVTQSVDAPENLPSHTSPERKKARAEFRKFLRQYEAMAKVMPTQPYRPHSYSIREVIELYAQGSFGPLTDVIVGQIQHYGAKDVLDAVFPTGDVPRKNVPFPEK